MNQINVEDLLRRLSVAARSEASPQIDVCSRVIETLSVHRRPAPLDLVPFAFAAVAMAIAATCLVAVLPAWQTLAEPWVAYLP